MHPPSLLGLTTVLITNPVFYHGNDHFPPARGAILFPGADLKAGCVFESGGRIFDICPLLSQTGTVRVNYRDTASRSYESGKFEGKGKAKEEEWVRGEYIVALGGVAQSESGSRLCPDEARVCFTSETTDHVGDLRTTTTTIVGRPQDVGSMVYIQNLTRNGREFDIWLVNGEAGVKITMSCSDLEELRYQDSLASLHIFKWETQHACPIGIGKGFRTAEEGKDSNTSDGDKEEESHRGDLAGDLPAGGVARKWTGVIVLLIGCMIIFATILVSSPQARHHTRACLQSSGHSAFLLLPNFRRLTQPVHKHFPHFRVREGRLVRWAREEMALNGDEDFMVNGSDGWSRLEGMEEYIPLKANLWNIKSPNVLRGTRDVYSTYGSVPFEGFEIDESGVGMRPTGGVEGVNGWIQTMPSRVRGLFR